MFPVKKEKKIVNRFRFFQYIFFLSCLLYIDAIHLIIFPNEAITLFDSLKREDHLHFQKSMHYQDDNHIKSQLKLWQDRMIKVHANLQNIPKKYNNKLSIIPAKFLEEIPFCSAVCLQL